MTITKTGRRNDFVEGASLEPEDEAEVILAGKQLVLHRKEDRAECLILGYVILMFLK